MVSFVTATTVPSTQLPLLSSMSTTNSSSSSSSSSSSQLFSFPMTRRRIGFNVVNEQIRIRTCAYKSKQVSQYPKKKSKQVSTFRNRKGTWEEPDDGSGSDYDDDEEEEDEDEDLGFESDWEDEKLTSSSSSSSDIHKYEVALFKEVEQLLGPEERAILQQNVAPDLAKISTATWSPLHTLALSGQIQEMDMLIDNGLDIDMVDKDGLTALHKAVIGKKEAVISHLLRKDASPHVKALDGATPLHYAVQVGAMQTVKLLIKNGVDVNAADNEGWTPLHISMQTRNRNIAKVLLVNGADKTRKNKDGKTPLDLSLCYGKDFKAYELAKLLKLVPANRELQGESAFQPLR